MSDVIDYYSPTADSYLYAGAADASFGSDGVMHLGLTGKGALYANRPVLRFDVSVIPSDATIDGAILRWYCELAAAGGGPCSMKQGTAALTESCTWNKYDGANAWPGGAGGWGDTEGVAVAFNQPSTTGWKQITTLGPIVAHAVSAHSGIVYLIAKQDDETGTANISYFQSRTSIYYRPQLIVYWTSPTGKHYITVAVNKDAGGYSHVPGDKGGADPQIAWGYDGVGIFRAILEFLLTSLPVYCTIKSARFVIHNQPGSAEVGHLYPISRTDWVEADATWDMYDAVNDWASPGGDYDASPSVAITWAFWGWYHVTVTDMAESARRAGKPLELLAKSDDEGTVGSSAWMTKENADYDDPYLVVEYEGFELTQGHVI